MAWHFKKCQDTLAVKGYSFVLFMSPLSLVCIVIPHIAVLDLSMLSVYNRCKCFVRNRVVGILNSVTG